MVPQPLAFPPSPFPLPLSPQDLCFTASRPESGTQLGDLQPCPNRPQFEKLGRKRSIMMNINVEFLKGFQIHFCLALLTIL